MILESFDDYNYEPATGEELSMFKLNEYNSETCNESMSINFDPSLEDLDVSLSASYDFCTNIVNISYEGTVYLNYSNYFPNLEQYLLKFIEDSAELNDYDFS